MRNFASGQGTILQFGFKMTDLIPVTHSMTAANSAPIRIDGAVLLILEGQCPNNRKVSAAVMTYISPDAKSFYLSEEALVQLEVLPKNFPQLGSAAPNDDVCGVKIKGDVAETEFADCGCRKRRTILPPTKAKGIALPTYQGEHSPNERMVASKICFFLV